MPLAGIHVELGVRAAAGQGGFPITPLGNDGAVAREWRCGARVGR